jgi:DNA mismatch endonuclease (patch repair protein)
VDKISKQRRSEIMSHIRSKDTAPEMAVRRIVFRMGYRYRLHANRLPGRPDLVFSGLRKIIQVYGCFFHQHEGCKAAHLPLSRTEYWIPKLKRNRARDKQHLKKLRAQGWDVLVIWACEIDTPALPDQNAAFLSGRTRKKIHEREQHGFG